MSLQVSQISQEIISVRVSFLIKLQALGTVNYKETPKQVFSCENLTKKLKKPSVKEQLQTTASRVNNFLYNELDELLNKRTNDI